MKNKFLLGFAALALLASCSDDEFGTTSAPTSYKVTAKYDDSFENQLAHKVKITITNTNSSEKYEILTNEAGEAVFQNVIPGVYDINATITLNKTELTLQMGEEDTLTVNYNPTYAKNKNVTWSSSNKKIATVEDGKKHEFSSSTI